MTESIGKGLVKALIAFSWFIACQVSAQGLSLKDPDQAYTLTSQIAYLLTDEDLNANQALQREAEFSGHHQNSTLNLGYSAKTLWLLFDLHNQSPLEQWIMEFGYYPPQTFEIYLFDRDHQLQEFDQKAHSWPSRYLAYALDLNQDLRVLIRLKTNASLTIPLTFSSAQYFTREKQSFYFAQALYFGWVISLTLYNLFLFISLRDLRFGYYVLFAGSLTAALAFYYGFPQQFFDIPYGDLTTIIGTSLFNLAIIFAIAFTRHFLNIRAFMPIGDKILQAVSAIFWLSIFSVILLPDNIVSSWILSAGAPIFTLMTIAMAGYILWRGHKQARFFLIAWSVLLVATTVGAARNFGWLETNTLTSYAIQIGSALEMLLLAIALADTMRIEREQHEQAQATNLADSLAQQGMLQKIQRELQSKVHYRAQNVHQSLSKVQTAFKTYMRFGAMISHEFKNPLNAIINQIETLKIEQQHGIDQAEKRLSAIERQTSRLRDLFEYWLSTDQLISGQLSTDFKLIAMHTWLHDSQELIQSVHPDHQFIFHNKLSPDSEALIDATLVQIGLFNLVDNACQYSKPGSPIVITATQNAQTLTLSVKNQPAKALSANDLKRCLNPYYSISSDTHSGTGLGLSLVKLICEVHHGELNAEINSAQESIFSLVLQTHQA